ncbi:unnamed protein product [Parajaminaea phylloscopi]
MRLLTASTLLVVGITTVAWAAPSQLVLSTVDDELRVAQPVAASSHREPDFVDILESEAKAVRPATMWPPSSPPGGSGGWVWSSCGQPSDAVEVQSIEVSPDPPVPGQNLTVKAKGIVKSRIEEGSIADVTVKIGLIKLLSKQFDICEEARNNDVAVKCPVQPGEYEITQVVALPREIPPAKFNVHVNAIGAKDEDLTCLDIAIDFRKH